MADLTRYVATLNGKPVAVYGLGKSGIATIQALQAAGATVFIGDDDRTKIQTFAQDGFIALDCDFKNLSECAALILAPGVPLQFPIPHAVVTAAHAHNIEIIGDIEIFARAYPHLKTVGITGTNGKSTTTALTAHILNHCGKTAIACGNIGVPILAITPTDDTIMVIEMSSFQIDLCPTFRPNITVHLNLTPDHLDRHGTIENYIAIKERLFQGPGIGFCGVDDDYSDAMFHRAQQNPARAIVPVSCTHALNHGLSLADDQLVDTHFEGGIVGSLSNLATLRGRHNHQNAMMAYGIARALNCAQAPIFTAMQTYPGLPHRQLRVRTIGQVDYINDSKATNADATDKALQTFDPIYWIVGGTPKAGGLTGLEHYAPHIKRAYLIGIAANDFADFMTTNNIPFEHAGTLDIAVAHAHRDAQSLNNPATVLLSPACASYDQFKSYEHRGDVFTELVQNLTTEKAA